MTRRALYRASRGAAKELDERRGMKRSALAVLTEIEGG
jgi:hypothetical protein